MRFNTASHYRNELRAKWFKLKSDFRAYRYAGFLIHKKFAWLPVKINNYHDHSEKYVWLESYYREYSGYWYVTKQTFFSEQVIEKDGKYEVV